MNVWVCSINNINIIEVIILYRILYYVTKCPMTWLFVDFRFDCYQVCGFYCG